MCVKFRVTERCVECHANSDLRTVLRRCDAAPCNNIDKSITYKHIVCQACNGKEEVANVLAIADKCVIKRLINKEFALVDRLKTPKYSEKSWLEVMRGLEWGEGREAYEEIFALQRDIDALLDECEQREEREG